MFYWDSQCIYLQSIYHFDEMETLAKLNLWNRSPWGHSKLGPGERLRHALWHCYLPAHLMGVKSNIIRIKYLEFIRIRMYNLEQANSVNFTHILSSLHSSFPSLGMNIDLSAYNIYHGFLLPVPGPTFLQITLQLFPSFFSYSWLQSLYRYHFSHSEHIIATSCESYLFRLSSYLFCPQMSDKLSLIAKFMVSLFQPTSFSRLSKLFHDLMVRI